MNSAWIQHEFNTIVKPSIAKKILKPKVKMKSAWNQHEFSMKPTWIQHQCHVGNRHKQFIFEENSKPKWNQHESSMNPAWIQHEFSKYRVSCMVWLDNGVEFMLVSCWIHVDFMLISFLPWVLKSFLQYLAWQWCWIHAEFMLNSCKTSKIN